MQAVHDARGQQLAMRRMIIIGGDGNTSVLGGLKGLSGDWGKNPHGLKKVAD